MMYADKLLNQAITMVLAGALKDELEHVSPIDEEDLGWYFWLPGIDGAYELVLEQWQKHADMEKTTFLLKYYPHPEAEVFNDFSCAEQIVRMSSCFEDQLLDADDEGDALDPGNEITSLRFQGVPRLQKRCFFEPNLFLIGKVSIFMNKDELIKSALETQTDYLEYSENGTPGEQDMQLFELAGSDDRDRKVNGLDLCRPFYDFLVHTLFAAMFLKAVKSEYYSTTGLISYRLEQEGYQNEYMNEVRKIELTNYYKEGLTI